MSQADIFFDMRHVHDLGLPFSSICMCFPGVNNYNPAYQCRLAQSNYFLPTIRVVAGNPNAAPISSLWAADMKVHGDFGLPVRIKDDNRAGPMCADKYRLDKTLANIDKSTVTMFTLDSQEPREGTATEPTNIDDSKMADMFGPTDVWEAEAKLRATDPYIKSIQQLIPNPAWVEDNENNEAYIWDSPAASIALTTLDKAKFVNGVPPRKWKPRSIPDPNGLPKNADNPTVLGFNIRLDRWIMANGGYNSDPNKFWPVFDAMSREKYGAYDQAFVDASPNGWKNRYTSAYGATRPPGFPEDPSVYAAVGPGLHQPNRYDAIGPAIYLRGAQDTLLGTNRLNSPGDQFYGTSVHQDVWNWVRAHNQRSYREVWVNLGPGGALAGARAGLHQIISPAIWNAFCQYLLWQCRATSGGVPVNLNYWDGWSILRTKRMFDTDTSVALAKSLGGNDLVDLTVDDYVNATIEAPNKICKSSLLRLFWTVGVTIPIVHTVGQRIPHCLIQLPDSSATLVYAYTPNALTGPAVVSVPGFGNISLDFGGKFYTYKVLIP